MNKISIDEELGKLDGRHVEEGVIVVAITGVRGGTHLCLRLL